MIITNCVLPNICQASLSTFSFNFHCPRRGFTLNGQPIGSTELTATSQQKLPDIKEESNAYFFWAIYLTLLLIALGNLITTLVIINVLRIGPEGMEAIEFSPSENIIKFFGNADFGNIYKHDGIISGYSGEDLALVGQDSSVTLQSNKRDEFPPRMKISKDGVSVSNVHDLSLLDPLTGDVVFSTSDPELSLPTGLHHLETEETEVERVVAGVEHQQSMLVRSDRRLHLRGAEGVQIEGKKLSLVSNEDISLTSHQGSVSLAAGLVLDTVMLPHGGLQGYQVSDDTFSVQSLQLLPMKGESGQYKLCVCMPSGKLFKVAVPDDNHLRASSEQIGCHSVLNTSLDPCN